MGEALLAEVDPAGVAAGGTSPQPINPKRTVTADEMRTKLRTLVS
jgi:hypothetical protein